ncbi:MAG: major tail protein [Bacillales bacterium]|jgi:hypothetical protein|nr:major tail protein [Bacillales bacterium]
MPTVIEEFDAIKITNASIQFFEGGVQQTGTPFGFIGELEGETELKELVKICEGVETNKTTLPVKMTLKVTGHTPVQVARDIFGLSTTDLKPGVWAYGSKSKGKKFVFTGDVMDEFQDLKKLIAFSNCVSNTGFQFKIENGADEVVQIEIEFTAMKDAEGNFYYEAITDELEDATITTNWHTTFTPELVKAAVV